MWIFDNLSHSNLYSMPVKGYAYKARFSSRIWLSLLIKLLLEGYGALQRAEQKRGRQNPRWFARGQCKCTQTAVYKEVPKAVGEKQKQSVKNLSDIWKENKTPLECFLYLIGKWFWHICYSYKRKRYINAKPLCIFK